MQLYVRILAERINASKVVQGQAISYAYSPAGRRPANRLFCSGRSDNAITSTRPQWAHAALIAGWRGEGDYSDDCMLGIDRSATMRFRLFYRIRTCAKGPVSSSRLQINILIDPSSSPPSVCLSATHAPLGCCRRLRSKPRLEY